MTVYKLEEIFHQKSILPRWASKIWLYLRYQNKVHPEHISKWLDDAIKHKDPYAGAALLHLTKTESSGSYLRQSITPEKVRDLYELAIRNITMRYGLYTPEPPFASEVISGISGDSKLESLVSPDYVHKRFLEATRKGNLREALYLFESVYQTPSYESMFAASDLAAVYTKNGDEAPLEANENLRLIFELTSHRYALREEFSADRIKRDFNACAHRFKSKNANHRDYYGETAQTILFYTIGDDKLRHQDCISEESIDALARAYDARSRGQASAHAKQMDAGAAEMIRICGLKSPDNETLDRLEKRILKTQKLKAQSFVL